MTGTIPSSLGSLTKLRYLGLGMCFLHGSVGAWVGKLERLEVLDLGANGGKRPDSCTAAVLNVLAGCCVV